MERFGWLAIQSRGAIRFAGFSSQPYPPQVLIQQVLLLVSSKPIEIIETVDISHPLDVVFLLRFWDYPIIRIKKPR